MHVKIIPDYYPVYKDFSDIIKTNTSELKSEYPVCGTTEQMIEDPGTSRSPVMLNAEELAGLALKCGFSTFQTVILLIKNAFEGHVYMAYNIRPDQLFSQGTILFQAKPQILILSFYKHFAQYKAGLTQIGKLLEGREADLAGINFELLVHTIIVNHIIRFPVSTFSACNILQYNSLPILCQQTMDKQFELAILGENALGEYELISRVNFIYAEKFKEFGHKVRIKEEVFSHYQRKLALALFPNVHSEEELDELMYKKLIEDKLNNTPKDVMMPDSGDPFNSETSREKLWIRDRTKALYRYVSKNCFEVHSATNSEHSFPELNHVFLEANTNYNEPVSNLATALLQYMRMLLLLSKVIVFRKTQGFAITDCLHPVSDTCGKEVLMSQDDLKFLRRSLDAKLVAYRMKSFTNYKMKFVMDDDLTEIHRHFLQKQIEYIDQQILQLQSDIKEVLKLKSHMSILKTSKN